MTRAVASRTAPMGPPAGYEDPVPVGGGDRAHRWRAVAWGQPVLVTVYGAVLDRVDRRRVAEEGPRLRNLPVSPHLVPVADAGITDEGAAFVARWLPDAPTLADRLARGPLPEDEVARAVSDAAAGLAALHEAGVVHGAVSPEALVVRGEEQDRVAVADPALAALAAIAGPPVPTLAAPELLQGQPATPAADVYALAATAVQLLTGRPPHGPPPPDEDTEELLLRILAGPPPDLIRAGVRPALAAALARALAIDPLGRPDVEGLAELVTAATPRSGAGSGDEIETLPPTATLAELDLGRLSAAGGTPLGSRYVLQERLGRGAMGEVWRGVRRDGLVPVAVKVLRAELTDDHALVTRFLQERTTLTGISHPNVVRVQDLVAEGSTLAIVMDLVEGPNLRRYQRSHERLAPGPACRLLAQLADGLAAVHRAGVVHRDLKPENVLLELPLAGADPPGRERPSERETVPGVADRSRPADPIVRLTDFGIARHPTGPSLTDLGQLLGTAEYLAPEVASGESVTAASDVYAFGVLAYELVAGRRPFEAEHPAALLRAHLEQAPPQPPGIDRRLWSVLASCLAKEPDDRPDAPTLRTEFVSLASSLASAPPLAAPTPAFMASKGADDAVLLAKNAVAVDASDDLLTAAGTAPPPEKPTEVATKRNRWRLVALAAAVAVVGASLGIWLQSRDRTDVAEPPPPSTASPGPEVRWASVQAVPGGPGEVRLTFDDFWEEPGFLQYRILRDGNVSLPDKVAQGAVSATITDLDPGTPHCFKVMGIFRADPDTTTTTGSQEVPTSCTNPGQETPTS